MGPKTSQVFLAAALLLSRPQAVPQTPPVFRAGVDLLVVEASVVDGSHKPIADLRAEDFRAQVDGNPRAVVFARYFGREPAKTPEPASVGEPAAPGFVSNLAGAPGHTLIFAIDQESIAPGNEKPLLDSSIQLLDAAGARDAVGLVSLDGGSVEISRDHDRVRAALQHLAGTRPTNLWLHEVTYDEASRIADRNDRNAFNSVVSRECQGSKIPGDFEMCQQEIRTQARDLMITTRLRAQKLLTMLGDLMTRLKPIDGPKEIVLISAGLPFDVELASAFADASRKAADARVLIHALHLDDIPFDTTRSRHITSPYGSREMTQGLGSIATMTGGSYYSAIGRAVGPIEQMAREFNHFYELGIQRQPGDAEHKTHHVELAVVRPNAIVRTRPEVADLAGAPAATADRLLALLQQPIDVADLPMLASHYTMRGESPGTVKIILASELGAASVVRPPIEWGYFVITAGKAIANGRLRVDLAASPAVVTANAVVPLGNYEVRIAAVDGDGRGGVLLFPLNAQLHAAGDLEISDLVAAPASGNKLEPRATITTGMKLVTMAEIYARDARAFDGVEVRLEVATANPAQTLAGLPIALQATANPNTRVAQSTINTELLDPGRYVLRTIVSKGGQEVGRVTRAIEVTR